MPIALITESLLLKSSARDGRILRDRMLSGFCVRMNARTRTFRVATSVSGKQFRLTLGHWPLMSVDEARSLAMEVLRECRAGRFPAREVKNALPTVAEALLAYCEAKGIKASSGKRYDSLMRTHFGDWLDRSVADLQGGAFPNHCRDFVQSKGAALVEVSRGLWGSLIKYINAVHGLELVSPFAKLAAAGLMPDRAQPRARVLQDCDLAAWRAAVDKLGERQRDFLLLTFYTGLRRNECRELQRQQIDFDKGVLSIPMTKNGKPHSLPITPLMAEILERRCAGLEAGEELFRGVSAEHVHSMVMRQGGPRFMLHDLRKLVATTGERLGLGDAVLRRILNHTPPKSDVLHRHYVSLGLADIREPLGLIQAELGRLIA
ncbi:site-specific integrase [Hydrogenophaga aquatica]